MAIPTFAAAKKSSHAPRDLHRVGDHYTAYNPPDPSTYPANAKTYTIKAGDTLWALGNQFYGNAYLWPQLWEANTWITDAHWIYPGDTLLVEGEAASSASAETGTAATATPATDTSSADQTPTPNTPLTTAEIAPVVGPPIALGTEWDIYCYGYTGDPNESLPNHVASFEDVEVLFQPGAEEQTNGVSMGDLIYISGGTATGITPGDVYLVVEPGDLVYHPRTNALVGRYYDFRGQVKIICADEHNARAIVTQSCKEIHAGAKLKPWPQLPIPLARIPALPAFCDDPSGKMGGFIVSSSGWEGALGEGNLVTIDLGHDDQVQPGDFFTVWRESPVLGQPRQILGEIGILTTEAHTATARIMDMRRSMIPGDRIEAK
ncbi:MAG TPA: LysM peptidoglycan-binding domain-containing protein [Thermoanaerobaculia bacterium]|nr:LysM peptidoglycan-binding domain-containing protein [Thermoanaerobaculia bacterium]